MIVAVIGKAEANLKPAQVASVQAGLLARVTVRRI